MSEKTITVRIKYGVSHDGVVYNPGDTFECPAESYEALKECFHLDKDGEAIPATNTASLADQKDRAEIIKFWKRKTVDEIKAELTTRGTEFPDDGKKDELIEILVGPEDEEVI